MSGNALAEHDYAETSALIRCSFCGKDQKQVKKLVTSSRKDGGLGRVSICDECYQLVHEIMDEEETQ